MKLPTYDEAKIESFATERTSTGDPLYFGFTADQLKPTSRVLTVRQIVARLKNKETKEIGKTRRKKRGKQILKQRVELLDLANIEIDQGAYQRLTNEGHVASIARNFVPEACPPPIICCRKYNGSAKVAADGQERIVGAVLAGYDQMSCVVIDVKSVQEEAYLFDLINCGRRTVPTPVIHKNRTLLGDPEALILEAAIQKAGMTVSQKQGNLVVKGSTRLHAVAKTYARDGKRNYEILTDALNVYRATWPSHKSVHLYLVAGISFVLYTYRECPATRRWHSPTKVAPAKVAELVSQQFGKFEELVKSLNKNRPADHNRLMNDLSYGKKVVEAYNKHTRGRGALNPSALGKAYAYLENNGGDE